MSRPAARREWESAAPGWAKWEPVVASWMEPATRLMLDEAAVTPGSAVLDLACGAGDQTLRTARRVGPRGRVVACDIAAAMLEHVRSAAAAAGLSNVTTLEGAAEELDLAPGSFDACVCRLGLMLFAAPAEALRAVHRALRAGGRFAAVVFTTPASNPFMTRPMEILRRHAGAPPPAPGRPGLFALGGDGVLETMLEDAGFADIRSRTLTLPLRMDSTARVLAMMREAFAAYRAVLAGCSDAVRAAAWAEVADLLEEFRSGSGFVARTEVKVTSGARPGPAS